MSLGRSSVVLLVLAAGCLCPDPEPTPPTPPPICTAPTIDPDRSLVIHDPSLLGSAFSFQKTLDAINASSGNPAPSAEALLQTMLDSFAATSFVHPVSAKPIPVDPRPAEAALVAAQMLDASSDQAMLPVGLFNRLDLAPNDGSNCGEYRIVYAKKQTSPGRLFIIFEAKLPNPAPASGLAGCQAVAELWADLSAEPDPAQRVARLEQFYYAGAVGFGAVVTHANYGVPFGQVRTNLFVQGPWMLREHRTAFVNGVPAFVADTVKENPLAEWFRDPSQLPSGLTAAEQQAFRNHFLSAPTCNLLRPDRADPAATPEQIVNGIGGGFDPRGDDFQSVSQTLEDDPASNTDPAFATALSTRLTALSTSVSDTELLGRAGAMTCGGCHQFSNGRALGSGATWPSSAGFVHITEGGQLSPALTSFFLPNRAANVARFVCDPTAAPVPSAPCPGAPQPTASALLAAPPPAPAAAARRVEAAVERQLRVGRATPSLREIDDARLAVISAARTLPTARGALEGQTQRELDAANARLEALVLRARLEERALPGAFVPVRRTH